MTVPTIGLELRNDEQADDGNPTIPKPIQAHGPVGQAERVSFAALLDGMAVKSDAALLASGSGSPSAVSANAADTPVSITVNAAAQFGKLLGVYPIWNADSSPFTAIVQGNQADHEHDRINDHINSLQWSFDFSVVAGTSVHAVDSGVVVYKYMGGVGNVLGYGNVLTIRSMNASGQFYYTTYAHLQSTSLSENDPVSAGQIIALSGDTGTQGHAHLHIQFGSTTKTDRLDGATSGTIYGTVADGTNDAVAPAYFAALTMDYRISINATDVIYYGTPGDDTFYANNLGDQVHARDGNNKIYGGSGGDLMDAGSGSDFFKGAGGNDTIDGGGGVNTAYYDGRPVDYTWSKNANGSWTIVDHRSGSPSGTDTLTNIQFLQFASGDNIALTSSVVSQNVTLNDAAVEAGGGTTILSVQSSTVYVNGVPSGTANFYYYSQVISGGFVLTNPNRTTFQFTSYDSAFAKLNGYFYDGPGVLVLPLNGDNVGGDTDHFGPDVIKIQKQNGTAFGMKSVQLDTAWGYSGEHVTFTGTKANGVVVTQQFTLDAVQGLQTFNFNTDFSNLAYAQFTSSSGNVLFDNFTFDPSPPAAAIVGVGKPSAQGIPGSIGQAQIATIQGVAVGDSTVTIYDDGSQIGTAVVATDGTWFFTTAPLSNHIHSFTVTDTVGSNVSDISGVVTFKPAPTVQADFDASGMSDLLLYNSIGQFATWEISGAAISGSTYLGQAIGWSAVATGDFNGDGSSDFLSTKAGYLLDYQMDQTGNVLDIKYLGLFNGWTVRGTGDFNGDGLADVVIQNGGNNVIEFMAADGTFGSAATYGEDVTGWITVGVGDFNKDGHADLLLRNSTSGDLVEWYSNAAGTGYQAASWLGTLANYTVSGVGDFNGDGIVDVLLRSSAGEFISWIMDNAGHPIAGYSLGTAPGYSVIGTGDYDGDGISDIALQNGGLVDEWLIKNGQLSAVSHISNGGASGWVVIG